MTTAEQHKIDEILSHIDKSLEAIIPPSVMKGPDARQLEKYR